MRFSLTLAVAFGTVAGLAGLAQAADLPGRDRQVGTRFVAPLRKRVSVVVDQLSLANGCPDDPRCIAPRVLPIVGFGDARERVYESVAIPVDPRFANRY